MADEKIMNEETDFITLQFENDEEVECEILGVFEANDKEYIALLPDDGTDDVYIYGFKEVNEEEFELIDIEDEDEFQKAVEVFEQLEIEEE
ncbi:MAG: DUF1292 domain-containing protein [Firmicutes bacterium]|nr:DUF1292 domain-containing protein [Bacillota bacterium]